MGHPTDQEKFDMRAAGIEAFKAGVSEHDARQRFYRMRGGRAYVLKMAAEFFRGYRDAKANAATGARPAVVSKPLPEPFPDEVGRLNGHTSPPGESVPLAPPEPAHGRPNPKEWR